MRAAAARRRPPAASLPPPAARPAPPPPAGAAASRRAPPATQPSDAPPAKRHAPPRRRPPPSPPWRSPAPLSAAAPEASVGGWLQQMPQWRIGGGAEGGFSERPAAAEPAGEERRWHPPQARPEAPTASTSVANARRPPSAAITGTSASARSAVERPKVEALAHKGWRRRRCGGGLLLRPPPRTLPPPRPLPCLAPPFEMAAATSEAAVARALDVRGQQPIRRCDGSVAGAALGAADGGSEVPEREKEECRDLSGERGVPRVVLQRLHLLAVDGEPSRLQVRRARRLDLGRRGGCTRPSAESPLPPPHGRPEASAAKKSDASSSAAAPCGGSSRRVCVQ